MRMMASIVGAFLAIAAFGSEAALAVEATFPFGGTAILSTGHVAGFTFEPQRPFSDSQSNVNGLFRVDAIQGDRIRFAPGVLRFANPEIDNFKPAPGGGGGSAPGTFGVDLVVPLGSGEAAIRNLAITLSGEAPLRFGNFDASNFVGVVTSGSLDYSFRSNALPGASGSRSLVGLPIDFGGSGNVTDSRRPDGSILRRISLNGGVQIPLTAVADNDSKLMLNMSLQGGAIVPEPMSAVLLIPAAGLLLRRRPIARRA